VRKYSGCYRKARPAEPRIHGRYPATVRSPDELLRFTVELRDGQIAPPPPGAQSEISCRQNTIEAALYYYTRIERAWMEGSGDFAFERLNVLMSLNDAPGYGECLP